MPDRIDRIARETQHSFAAQAQAAPQRGAEAPAEVRALDARLERLRERRKAGDPDMQPAELLEVIAKVEAKRAQLLAGMPEATQSVKILTMLPEAAALLRRQIEDGLDGNPRAAAKARVILRQLFGGLIRMCPEPDGSLWAEYSLHKMALIQACGTGGSAGVLRNSRNMNSHEIFFDRES
jgi:site-specific DNA recombinase